MVQPTMKLAAICGYLLVLAACSGGKGSSQAATPLAGTATPCIDTPPTPPTPPELSTNATCRNDPKYMATFIANYDGTFKPTDRASSPRRLCQGDDGKVSAVEDCNTDITARPDLRQFGPKDDTPNGVTGYKAWHLIARGQNEGSLTEFRMKWPTHATVYIFATPDTGSPVVGSDDGNQHAGLALQMYFVGPTGQGWLPSLSYRVCNPHPLPVPDDHHVSFQEGCNNPGGPAPTAITIAANFFARYPQLKGIVHITEVTSPPWFACGNDCCMVDS
jgi:hypothetical protein